MDDTLGMMEKIKKSVSLEDLLGQYGIGRNNFEKSEGSYFRKCFFKHIDCQGTLIVNFEKNEWACSGECNGKGGVLEMVAMIERKNCQKESLSTAAELIVGWFRL